MTTPVVITRPHGPYAGAKHLEDALRAQGFSSFHLSVLVCERLEISDDERALLTELCAPGAVRWLVFLSPTAVAVFRDLLVSELSGANLPSSVQIAVQGVGSREVVRQCFSRDADFMPSVFVAEQFAEEFCARVSSDARVLVAQSSEGRDVFGRTLVARGYRVATVQTYTTKAVTPAIHEINHFLSICQGGELFLLFMSPSAVNATVSALTSCEDSLRKARIISVGPITSHAIRKHGLQVAAEATEHSEAGVVRALCQLTSKGYTE
jgi:uroporphyrinogen-III synthase